MRPGSPLVQMEDEGEEEAVEVKGLSTDEAFDRLISAITDRMENHKATVGRNWGEVFLSSLSTRSRHSTITWSSLLILFIESVIVFTLYSTSSSPMWANLLPEGIVILLLFGGNVALVVWENMKRVNELPAKLEIILNQLREIATSDILWEPKNYPDLFMPVSPCISLQWCYRDGKLVNLPWVLLVHGDIVVLHPAQKILADCHLVEKPEVTLKAGDLFSPLAPPTGCGESSPSEDSQARSMPPPRLHHPLGEYEALVTTAPYLDMVELCFSTYLVRPPSFFNKERHTVVARIIESVVIPLGIMTFVALCLVRMFYLPHWLGIRVAPWADITLLQPMAATFPLIPVSLPFLWTLLMCVGNARLWKGLKFCNYGQTEDVISSPDKNEKVVLNEWKQHTRNFIDSVNGIKAFFLGREETLHRSQKLLHILASATALCCVDKKGILSWPNPTADKIFFFRTVPQQLGGEEAGSGSGAEPPPPTKPAPSQRRKSSSTQSQASSMPMTTVAEVMDITVDNNNELQFDDTQWENYIPNLKPLGLNILLNTCNKKTQQAYSAFHSHISHELLFGEKNVNSSHGLLIPVTSRRCLCEVASIIGFQERATTPFELEQKLCSFRHIESDQLSRDQLAKARIKFPFPHMMSVVAKEKASQTLQLFSQGSGDIVTDVSEDFWDGRDLRPMTDHERKLISDFYQRMSLSSICTAFAYRPVPTKVNSSIASLYMELPASRGLRCHVGYGYGLHHHLHNPPHHSELPSMQNSPFLNLRPQPDSHISTDCLIEHRQASKEEIQDVQGFLDVQNGQIFLGMITMQYQACGDFVQLIEQLDQGCIRFVHFSKENELRSRVFSAKMGLESGWNCHISLTAAEETNMEAGSEENLNVDLKSQTSFPLEQDDDLLKCRNNRLKMKRSSCPKSGVNHLTHEEAALLPRFSASVPEIVMLSRRNGDSQSQDDSSKTETSSNDNTDPPTVKEASCNELTFSLSSEEEEPSTVKVRFEENSLQADSNQNSAYFRQSSIVGSSSSAVLSPDSFPEMYELVQQQTPLGIDGIDLDNRAQLPIGIENIRPHLESVDNVPLLVSLFTDCNADNTGEMINIMQDYGEVSLILGSACNFENRRLFLQADASCAVEPLYPQACRKAETFVAPKNGGPSPSDIAMLLTSLPCALSLRRKDCPMFYYLIGTARHFMNKCVRNSVQFWVCCNCSVTFLGLLALLMLLPPLYSLSDTMWLSCVIVPILTLGLAFAILSRYDISVMNSPSWKNQMVIDHQMMVYAFWCYGLKFIPSIINVTLMGAFNLRWICASLPNTTCSWVYPVKTPPVVLVGEALKPLVHRPTQCISTWSCENLSRLIYVQQFCTFFLVFYFVVISSCFVYRSQYLWERNPASNRIWAVTSVFVLFLQLFYWTVKVGASKDPVYDLLPSYSYLWGFLWVPLALGLNELIRRYEIKANIRYEKRARLDFGTKLGMNSPF